MEANHQDLLLPPLPPAPEAQEAQEAVLSETSCGLASVEDPSEADSEHYVLRSDSKASRQAPELSPEDITSIYEHEPISSSRVAELLGGHMDNANQSILSCLLASVNESTLPKKSIDWVLKEVEAYFNGHCDPGHGPKDTQRNERRTIILGYVLLTIFELKNCQESEMVTSNEKHLFNLGEKSLIQESAKIACQFEKRVQLKQEEGEASKLLCDSLFAKATEGLSGRKEGQRRIVLTGIEALENTGAVNMWLNSISKDCSERDDTTTMAGDNVRNMDEVESVESPLVVTIDLKERDLMALSLPRIQEDLANEKGSHDASSEVKQQEQLNHSLTGAGVWQQLGEKEVTEGIAEPGQQEQQKSMAKLNREVLCNPCESFNLNIPEPPRNGPLSPIASLIDLEAEHQEVSKILTKFNFSLQNPFVATRREELLESKAEDSLFNALTIPFEVINSILRPCEACTEEEVKTNAIDDAIVDAIEEVIKDAIKDALDDEKAKGGNSAEAVEEEGRSGPEGL